MDNGVDALEHLERLTVISQVSPKESFFRILSRNLKISSSDFVAVLEKVSHYGSSRFPTCSRHADATWRCSFHINLLSKCLAILSVQRNPAIIGPRCSKASSANAWYQYCPVGSPTWTARLTFPSLLRPY